MNLKEHEDLVLKVEKAKEQIARLRKEQEDLEHEKQELEDLRNKQDEWYRGRREIGDALRKAIAVLDTEEAGINKMNVLVRNAREGFSAVFDELAAVKEDRWTPATLKEDLSKALLVIQKARKELSTARARIPALDEKRMEGAGEEVGLPAGEAWRIGTLGAGDLIRIGFWLALPAALMAVVIIIVLALM
jgi:chromosome segregation ATPase